jgi:4-hydroxy-3-polyprenylbenzoate decarboxylase
MNDDGLRSWLARARELGEVSDITGARWEDEIGQITEMFHHTDDAPVGVFDEIPGYPAGHRIAINALATRRRLAMTLGLPLDIDRVELMDRFLELTESGKGIPPLEVDAAGAAVFQNSMRGDEVDVESFPTPLWHPKDGGRYIGTGVGVVMKDPDSDWVNVGTYRVQVHGKNRVGVYISPGKHGKQFQDSYFSRGEPCPVAIVCGFDPLLFIASTVEVPFGISEYEWAGGIRNAPYEIVRGPITGLPIPASAEIVLEGFLYPGDLESEGPFGEWHGYYASGARDEPAMTVEAVHFRDQPILLGSPPNKPPWEPMRYREYLRSALMKRNLAAAGVPGIVDVQCFAVGGNRLFNAISIEQKYAGHATQVLHVASQGHAGAYLGRITVVTDDDIDVSDINDVIWAIVTRADPARDMDIIRRAWSGPLDTAIHPDEKGMNSRLLIDATRPWEWRDRFPETIGPDPATKLATRERWGHLLRPGA